MIITDNKLQEKVEHVLNYFDFERTFKMMRAVDFGWTNEETSVGDLRVFARELILNTLKDVNSSRKQRYFCGTGGFQVEVETEDLNNVFIHLSFCPLEWDTEVFDYE